MNKTLTTLAVMALTAAATPALAQSSVTLFGLLDVNARVVKNNDTQNRLDNSGLSSSRIGVRGTEDLGGGLKAHFWLEGAVAPDTGEGGNWQRRSTIGLQGGFGEVRLGREKNPNGLTMEQLDPFSDTGMGSVTRTVSNSITRSSNQISYYTPGSEGFFFHGAVAAGEGTPGNKQTSARLGYRTKALTAIVSYGTTELTGTTDLDRLVVGGTYDFGGFKLFGQYINSEAGPAEQDNYLLGLTTKLAGLDMRASYQKMDGSGSISNRSADHISLGVSKPLSRRTTLYGTYSRISNTNSSFTVATGSPLSVGNNSTGYEVGVRHSF
jgi:predicted porin